MGSDPRMSVSCTNIWFMNAITRAPIVRCCAMCAGTGRSRSSERFGEWRRRLGPRARWIGPSIRRWPLETSWSPFRRSSWCSPTARQPAIVWSRRRDQLSWLQCHNESYRRLQGVAAVNRIDNVKTAIASGGGPWGEIHPLYRAYARSVGFHIDACRPGQAQEKGKVEAKVRLSRLLVEPQSQYWEDLEELQHFTDGQVSRWSRRAVCPATGLTVEESWRAELERLAPLPILPEPFDVVVTRPVHRDCMVRFEDHCYPVPFQWVGRQVEVRGCSGKVQILAEGKVLREYERHTPARILIDPSCWQGEATERVLAPPPLGKMGQRLEQIYQMPVEQRPLDLYQALAEVAR